MSAELRDHEQATLWALYCVLGPFGQESAMSGSLGCGVDDVWRHAGGKRRTVRLDLEHLQRHGLVVALNDRLWAFTPEGWSLVSSLRGAA